jgi:hypothetical protein
MTKYRPQQRHTPHESEPTVSPIIALSTRIYLFPATTQPQLHTVRGRGAAIIDREFFCNNNNGRLHGSAFNRNYIRTGTNR